MAQVPLRSPSQWPTCVAAWLAAAIPASDVSLPWPMTAAAADVLSYTAGHRGLPVLLLLVPLGVWTSPEDGMLCATLSEYLKPLHNETRWEVSQVANGDCRPCLACRP